MSGFLDVRDYPDVCELVERFRRKWWELRQEGGGEIESFIKSPEVDIQNAEDIRLFILPLKWQGEPVNTGHRLTYGLPYGAEILNRMPVAAEVVRNPLVVSAMFSLSLPGCELIPHIDNESWIGDVWRIHIGLDCPVGCALMVDGQVKEWSDGEALMFDSARVEHSAWNRGSAPRLILIVDVKRLA